MVNESEWVDPCTSAKHPSVKQLLWTFKDSSSPSWNI